MSTHNRNRVDGNQILDDAKKAIAAKTMGLRVHAYKPL